jgi:hypothetical protein
MGIFVRAVVTGFAFSLGAAVFKKVSNKLGLEEAKDGNAKDAAADKEAEGEEKENDEPAPAS